MPESMPEVRTSDEKYYAAGLAMDREFRTPGGKFRSGPQDIRRLEQIRSRLMALVAIAGEHHAPVRVEDVMELLPFRAFNTAAEMGRFVDEDPILSGTIGVFNGLLVEKGKVDLIASHPERAALASNRVAVARTFVNRLSSICPWLLVAGISGSTTYGHAQPEDDLDFFLVVERRRLWVTLLAAFVLARLDRKMVGAPVYCFNRTLEEYACSSDFNDHRDPLVAREALTMLILRGESHYADILRTADWMAQYFPELHATRTRIRETNEGPSPRRGGIHWTLANGVAFLVVAGYLGIMGFVRNAQLAREGRLDAQFRTVLRKGFCAYESNKYDGLRETYRRAIE